MTGYKLTIYEKCLIVLVVSLVNCRLVSGIACGEPVSSSELINNAKQYDGKAVQYEGEVIGDIMKRGDHAWINVTDGQNAIGIWADNSLAKDITYTGGYKTKGDKIGCAGIFHRACIEHGGDLDIHAQSVARIASGSRTFEELDFNKIKTAFKLSGILVILFLWGLLNRRKRPSR